MAHDRPVGDRHIAGDYRDRDRDCSLATNMNRIGSDSYPVLPKLVYPDCRLSERFSFHNIANQRRSSCVRAPARNPRWLNPAPSTAAKGTYLVGARKQGWPGTTLLGTLWM